MKSITTALALVVHLTTLSLAAPHAELIEERQFVESLTFFGASGSGYTVQIPADDQTHPINNTLSVSQVTSPGGGSCTVFGVDGTDTFIHGGTVDIGPPQAQVSAICDI